jgi:prepilin-type N-terminal cleavage/methylation domain-containing protein
LIRRRRTCRSTDSPTAASGFTLLEVVVTLLLLGLAAALVATAFRGDPPPRDEFDTVLAQARELAVRRAQSLTLEIDAQGRWKLTPSGDSSSISAGTIRPSIEAPLKVTISPFGTCLSEPVIPPGWDALACRVRRSEIK